MMRRTRNPGLKYQGGLRITLRILGAIFTLAGVALIAMWLLNVSSLLHWSSMLEARATEINSPEDLDSFWRSMDGFGPFGSIWMPIGGGMLFSAGVWMLRVGFLGFAARFLAGETAPVVKDTAEYVTDGQGVFNIGRQQGSNGQGTVYRCPGCTATNPESARFCQACGQQIG